MKRRMLRLLAAMPVWGRSWLAALVLALLMGPWLGALHRIVHAPGADAQVHAADGFKDVFGPHHRAADCLAYDQLSHGDALIAQALILAPHTCPAAPAWAGTAWAPLRPLAAFRARAPPAPLA